MQYRLLTVFFLLITFSSIAQTAKPAAAPQKDAKVPIDYHEIGAPMPDFKLVTLDTLAKELSGKELKRANKKLRKKLGYVPVTRVVTANDLPTDRAIFIMMFNPTCGHCEDQTELIKKNIAIFDKNKLFLLANPVSKAYLPDFVKNHKTKDFYPTITVGLDSANFINATFQYGALPQIVIYSADHKLLKSYNGEIQLDSLKQFMN